MNRIVIIGGGFAGLCAAQRLSRAAGVDVTLIDKRPENHFLPMLPDLIGHRLRPDRLMYSLARAGKEWGFAFHCDEVRQVDLERRSVYGESNAYPYDRLLVSPGTVTDFYGMDQLRRHAIVLEDSLDATRILQEARNAARRNFVVVGGSYTGIEVATQLWRLFCKNGVKKRIAIVEITPNLCPIIPPNLREYVDETVRAMDIAVHRETSVEEYDGHSVDLSNGKTYRNAVLIWTAGRKTPEFVQSLPCEHADSGRLVVDSHLRVTDDCYAAGDAAAFMIEGRPHRLAVQFSISQGRTAAVNILRSLHGRPVKPFRPLDLGYVVPMANHRGCGVILGRHFAGRIPSLLHYTMCVYRSWNMENRVGVFNDIVWRDRACPSRRPSPE